MSNDRDIRALDAKALALEMVFAHVFNRIGKLDPVLAAAIQQGFNDASHEMEELAIKSESAESSDRAVNALAIVEHLRVMTLANSDRNANDI